MNKGRRLLKFKYGSGSDESFKKCLVRFEQVRDDESYDIFSFECDDEPHPDLKEALEGMVPALLENCEIDADEKHKVFVRSVTCTHKQMEGFEVHGLVISGLRDLHTCKAPMNLNSPHKTDVPYSEDGDDSFCLSSATLEALDALETQVFAYVDGKRAQAEFDFSETPASEQIPA